VSSEHWTWRITRGEATTVAAARHALARMLRLGAHGNDNVDVAVQILGELIANACEHGRVPIDIALRRHGRRYELEVADSGSDIARPNAKHAPDSLRGRGFEIIEGLGGIIAITARPRSTVRVTLPF